MSLMRHVIKTSTLLVEMRVIGHHAVAHPLDGAGHDDDEGDDNDHDHEDGDDDASSVSIPSHHGHQGVGDPYGSTPSR